jgi:predicted dehydrogenase
VLGDLASHAVDLVRHLLGDITSVVTDTAVFIPERPRPTGPTSGHGQVVGGEVGPVENDDYVSALLRLASGARAVLEASRVAVGEQNSYGFEVHGTSGRLAWDFRRMGELAVSRGSDAQDQPVSTVLVGPGAGDLVAFQPGPGMAMGYDDLKVVEARDFLRSIAEGRSSGADVRDAVRAAVTVDALAASAAGGGWVDVPAS